MKICHSFFTGWLNICQRLPIACMPPLPYAPCNHHWPMQPLPLRCRAPLPKVTIVYFVSQWRHCLKSLAHACQSTIVLLPKFGDLSILVTTYHRFFTKLSVTNSLTNTLWSHNFHLLYQKFWWQKVVFLLVF